MNTLYKCQRALRSSGSIFWMQRMGVATADSKNDEQPPTFLDEPPSEAPVNPKMFNKSRLWPQHQNILHEQTPYDEPQSWIHLSEKYQRKMFGRYGAKSAIDPKICFPTKADVAEAETYEKVAHPLTLAEMMAKARHEKEQKRAAVQQREDDIAKKLEKLEQWKIDLNTKIAKKEAEVLAAKERKERLIEEVRRHFGFKVDPRDERFKEMLELKEREDRKLQKEAKRKAKEDKMMAKLIGKTAAKPSAAATPASAE